MADTYLVNPLMKLVLDSPSPKLKRFFDIKYADLYDGELDTDRATTVRFIEQETIEIERPQVLREITIPKLCLFNDEDFLIVRDQKKLRLPFEDIGTSRELTLSFEKGFPIDWIRRLLDDMLAFHAVGRGGSFVHAGCLAHQDFELIMPAWRGTGKTNLALHLLISEKYAYKGEDQFFIYDDGNSYVFTDATHIDYKHMMSFPALKKKYRSFMFWLRAGITRPALAIIPPTGVICEFLRRGFQKVLTPKVFVKIRDFIPDLVITHDQPKRRVVLQVIACPGLTDVSIREQDLDAAIDRIIGGMQYERLDFYPFYFGWAYATGKRNPVVDNVFEKERGNLRKALAGSKCYEVLTPVYGYDWTKGFDNLKPLLEDTGA